MALIFLIDAYDLIPEQGLQHFGMDIVVFKKLEDLEESRQHPGIMIDVLINGCETIKRRARLKQLYPGVPLLHIGNLADIDSYSDLVATNPAFAAMLPGKLLSYIRQCLQARYNPACGAAGTYIQGRSPAMRQVYDTLALAAPTDYHLIICGETGTGKEALARMAHDMSPRRNEPFITVDCGCLSGETAASELFGHVKGAFTDALTDKIGVFEAASGGTLFLDEIGNLPYEVQVSLLRSIQQKAIRRTGDVMERKVDVRIIAATNEDLLHNVDQGSFRKDLYYRLNEISLYVPPLRERPEDIEAFCTLIISETCAGLDMPAKKLTEDAMRAIAGYSWPGNIRELQNTLKRACLLAGEGQGIDIDALPDVVARITENAGEPEQEKDEGLKASVLDAEYKQIISVLQSVKFNRKKAAELLNIHRKTLYNKLKSMKALAGHTG